MDFASLQNLGNHVPLVGKWLAMYADSLVPNTIPTDYYYRSGEQFKNASRCNPSCTYTAVCNLLCSVNFNSTYGHVVINSFTIMWTSQLGLYQWNIAGKPFTIFYNHAFDVITMVLSTCIEKLIPCINC